MEGADDDDDFTKAQSLLSFHSSTLPIHQATLTMFAVHVDARTKLDGAVLSTRSEFRGEKIAQTSLSSAMESFFVTGLPTSTSWLKYPNNSY